MGLENWVWFFPDVQDSQGVSASKVTSKSGGALNSTHSLTYSLVFRLANNVTHDQLQAYTVTTCSIPPIWRRYVA